MLLLNNVSKVYGEGPAQVVALKDITIRIDDGEFVAIMGPSGSGKSTLLNVVGGLDSISGGEVWLDDVRIDRLGERDFVRIRRNSIACVFQQYHLLPSLTAVENVLLPLAFHGSGKDDKNRAMALLDRVGLANRARHRPGQLSGGEQQRVAIARAMINGCSMILADEPTGNLDQKTGNQILALFEEINRDGYTVLMVTHSPDIACHAGREIHLEDGMIVSDTGLNQ